MLFATWCEVDLDKGIWEIPAERMKIKRPHLAHFSTQVIELFNHLKPMTSHYPYIFIGRRNRKKPINRESINQVIELLGYKGRATGHVFRHSLSTILHEKGYNSNWIKAAIGAC